MGSIPALTSQPAWRRQATNLTAPFTGHGVVNTGCGQRLISDFIQRGNAEALDTSCLNGIKRPPFFLTPAGASTATTSGGGSR